MNNIELHLTKNTKKLHSFCLFEKNVILLLIKIFDNFFVDGHSVFGMSRAVTKTKTKMLIQSIDTELNMSYSGTFVNVFG